MAKRDPGKEQVLPAPSASQLESFLAIVRWGKQAAVEAALGRSQSQISRDLSSLERTLGVELLDRTTRKSTPAGDVLLRYAEEVLEGWVATRERLQGESQVKGTVTIVAPCEAHEALLVSLLSRLGKRWKDLRVLTSLAAPADAAKMIRSGAADVGILPARMYEGLNVRPLCRARLCAAVATRGAWASRKSIPVNPGPSAQLLISNPQASALCDLLKQRPSGSSGRKMRFGSWGGGRSTLLEAVAAQLGIGWFLFFEEYGDPLARQLPTGVLLKPVSGMPARIPFCLAIRKGRRPGGAVEFVLREVLRHFRR